MKDVLSDNSARHVTITTEEDLKKKPGSQENYGKKAFGCFKDFNGRQALPTVWKRERIIKGKTAYGCSNWKEGCQYRLPFDKM